MPSEVEYFLWRFKLSREFFSSTFPYLWDQTCAYDMSKTDMFKAVFGEADRDKLPTFKHGKGGFLSDSIM